LANSQRFFLKISAYLYQVPSLNTFSLSYLMFCIVPIVAIYAPFGHLFDAFCPKFGEFGKFHNYRSPFGTFPAVDCVSAESDLYDTHFHSDNCSEPESRWRVRCVCSCAYVCAFVHEFRRAGVWVHAHKNNGPEAVLFLAFHR